MKQPGPSKQAHPLLDLLLTVILPSVVLESLSKPERLGPLWALVVALLLPIAFGVYCFTHNRGLSFFSIFGLVAVIVTGGLGLMNLSVGWFAAKEAAFPVFLGLAFPLSHRWDKPLVAELLLNPQMINYRALHLALNTREKEAAFQRLLRKAGWTMAAASFLTAAANSVLAIYLIGEKAPGTEEYVKALGALNWIGFIIIGIPLLAATVGLLFWLLRAIQRLTGLDRQDLLTHGSTVRRQVG